MPDTTNYKDTDLYPIRGYTFEEMENWSDARWDYELYMSGLVTVHDPDERYMWEEKAMQAKKEMLPEELAELEKSEREALERDRALTRLEQSELENDDFELEELDPQEFGARSW